MALVKQNLKNSLLASFKSKNKTDEEAAEELASIIDSYIRTATVSTLVTGSSPGGPVTGKGTGGLS